MMALPKRISQRPPRGPSLPKQPVDGHVAAGLRRQHDAGDDEPGEEPLGQLLRHVEAAGREGVAGRDVGGEDQGEREAGHQHDEAAETGDQPVDPVRGGDGALRHRPRGGDAIRGHHHAAPAAARTSVTKSP